jgi:squalene-hopene/tetraprenyl-beta-curcumene cyclase
MHNEDVHDGRLVGAYETVRRELLAQRTSEGHWIGHLASSPLSTAAAISALVIAHRDDAAGAQPAQRKRGEFFASDQIVQGDLCELIVGSLYWLARHQNEDGGWGDTDHSVSNIATTMLVRAAYQLTGVPAKYSGLAERADRYIAAQGGVPALRRRFGKDKTLAAAILMNSALAGLVPWRQVPALPFEWTCLPQQWYHRLHLPVDSFAIPAMVAIGHAKFHHNPPRNPLVRQWRRWALEKSLSVVAGSQAANGSFVETMPLTSFVVMSLASMGHADHAIVRQGVEFLLSSVQSDGSWPIHTNLSVWNTALALNALLNAPNGVPEVQVADCLDWLLECQFAGFQRPGDGGAGGWSWTDEPGGVPDANDTAGALLALASIQRALPRLEALRVEDAARGGVRWLTELQNRDGGWPTFRRGWETVPLDCSATDVTAHVLRALGAWHERWTGNVGTVEVSHLIHRIDLAVPRALRFLELQQRDDGSFLPHWFGNQFTSGEENPICGTALVLAAAAQLELESPMAARAAMWLKGAQLDGGGWGSSSAAPANGRSRTDSRMLRHGHPSVEETSLAVTALEPMALKDENYRAAVRDGLQWLIEAVENGRHREPAPICVYFGRMLYHEQLYPLVFAAGALAQAVRRLNNEEHTVAAFRT